jgi:ribonuclease D
MSSDQVNRRGTEILAAVERGLAVPESEIPVFERGRRPAPDPSFDARLERLKAARNAAAERLAIAPGVLCPNGTLEAIARVEPKTPEELRAIAGVRRWQVEALGSELLAAMTASAA